VTLNCSYGYPTFEIGRGQDAVKGHYPTQNIAVFRVVVIEKLSSTMQLWTPDIKRCTSFLAIYRSLLHYGDTLLFPPGVRISQHVIGILLYTLCPKNVTTLSRRNSDTRESILIIFGKNVTEEIGDQKVLHFPTSPN